MFEYGGQKAVGSTGNAQTGHARSACLFLAPQHETADQNGGLLVFGLYFVLLVFALYFVTSLSRDHLHLDQTTYTYTYTFLFLSGKLDSKVTSTYSNLFLFLCS